MSHDLEVIDGMAQAMFAAVPWHRLGTVYGDNFGWADAEREGLAFTMPVEKVPMGDLIIGYKCQDDEYAALRGDGLVVATGLGEQWTPFQVSEGYEFGRCVQEQATEVFGYKADLRSAGLINNGRKWFLTFDLGEFNIGEYSIRDYVSVNGSFDSSWKLQLLSSPIVEVCANTIAAAKAAGVVHYSFKHTSGIKNRVEEAKRALARHAQNREAFATLGEALLAVDVSPRTYGQLLDAMFPVPDEETTKATNARESHIEGITKWYKGLNTGANRVASQGNAWAFVQAVNTHENWTAPVRNTLGRNEETTRALKQVDQLVSGRQPLTDKAFELVGALN